MVCDWPYVSGRSIAPSFLCTTWQSSAVVPFGVGGNAELGQITGDSVGEGVSTLANQCILWHILLV